MTMRDDLLAIARAAIAGVAPGPAMHRHLRREGSTLFAAGRVYDLDAANRVVVLGAGKAGAAMASAAERILGDALDSGLVVVKDGHIPQDDPPQVVEILEAAHPIPDGRGQHAAARLLELAESLGENDLAIVLLSGGASALTPLPAEGLSLEDVQEVTRAVMAAGGDIQALNAVRKHLSRFSGGRLARALAPARSVVLVISDVLGDDLGTIASGPTSPDPTTFAQCQEIIARLGVAQHLPESIRQRFQDHLDAGARGEIPETPKPGEDCFALLRHQIIACNQDALDAAAQEAQRLGYGPRIVSAQLSGEARDQVPAMLQAARDELALRGPGDPPTCLLWGGETTVTVRGSGLGGRNQELALAALQALDAPDATDLRNHVGLVACGTDGSDGPTDAAGALALAQGLDRAHSLGLDPAAFLDANDAYTFFQHTGDLLVTGPTLTNVMDIVAVVVRP